VVQIQFHLGFDQGSHKSRAGTFIFRFEVGPQESLSLGSRHLDNFKYDGHFPTENLLFSSPDKPGSQFQESLSLETDSGEFLGSCPIKLSGRGNWDY
jgi:hypothetical protein